MQPKDDNIQRVHRAMLELARSRLGTEESEKMRTLLQRILDELQLHHVHALAWIMERYRVAPSATAIIEVIDNYCLIQRSADAPRRIAKSIEEPSGCIVGSSKLLDYFESAEYRTSLRRLSRKLN